MHFMPTGMNTVSIDET